MHEGTITLSEVKDKATLKKLLGLAKDAEVTVSPEKYPRMLTTWPAFWASTETPLRNSPTHCALQ